MLSIAHEAPLEVLRKVPELVPALLRESLGLELPSFTAASRTDSDFTQVRPAPFRADLAVTLHGKDGQQRPAMGIIVEIQRSRDRRKRRSWPLYTAALHAQLHCQTCLVVVAMDEGVARWAGAPIRTLQPGSPFTPLVLGPGRIPRVSRERARREPWMAALSALAHGNDPDGTSIVLAAVAALDGLEDERARVCLDLIRESLNDAALRALEDEMQVGNYEISSTIARYFEEKGQIRATRRALLEVAEKRFGLTGDEIRRPIEACRELEHLTALFSQINTARDRRTVQRLVAELEAQLAQPAQPARTARHQAPRARTKTARTTRTGRGARAGSTGRATRRAQVSRTARAARTAQVSRTARAARTARTARATRARVAR